MQYDFHTANTIGELFFLRGIERIDAYAMIERLAFHKYTFCKAAETAFRDRAARTYDRWIEVDPKGFGRMKGRP